MAKKAKSKSKTVKKPVKTVKKSKIKINSKNVKGELDKFEKQTKKKIWDVQIQSGIIKYLISNPQDKESNEKYKRILLNYRGLK